MNFDSRSHFTSSPIHLPSLKRPLDVRVLWSGIDREREGERERPIDHQLERFIFDSDSLASAGHLERTSDFPR